jgi:WD40 repeat protein/class 3 adenylate cyclase
LARETIDDDRSTTALTFWIADVRGYTRFTRERGDRAAAMLAKKFAELARDAVEARSGRVIELRGDEALAVFHDPAQAVRAAVEFQASCAEESAADPAFPLYVGVGIDTGEAVPVEDGYRGAALNMAARLCSGAGAGQVLVTTSVAESSSSLDEIRFVERGPMSFKGFEQEVDVIEAVGAEAVAAAPAIETRSLEAWPDEGIPPELDPLTPLIDRDHEMRWLRGTWRQVSRGRGRVLFVSGPAQIGKTRLAGEFAVYVHRSGGLIRYAGPGGAAAAMALSSIREALQADSPTLLIVDDVDVAGPGVAEVLLASLDALSGRPALLVGLLRDPASSGTLSSAIEWADQRGDGHRVLTPLDLDGVLGIVRLYAGDDAADVPLESIARASQGVPGRVHEVVSDWARSEASRRLAAAAEFLSAGRDRRASDLEFANNVIGLKLGRLFTVEGRDVLSLDICPYKGLAAFEEGDSAYFFGREQLVGELAARTVQVGLLGVVGASGSGKSSVVAAGLLPSLRAGLLPGSEHWVQVSMRPGEHPTRELRAALSSEGPDPIAAAVADTSRDGRLLLVVDQFEETFTICATEEERNEFIALLTEAAKYLPEKVAVILVMRGDYYGHCGPYRELAGAIAANHVLVGPLTREELRRAIELPGRRSGHRVESALVDALVEEVADEPGGLPLLSTALVELWQAREGGWIRLEAYERTGGVRGAVARLAESSYERLSDTERDSARRVFLRLVAAGEGEAVTRRRVSIEEFDLDRDAAAAGLIDRLVQDRLLTMSEGTVEVAHEALLREWPRLQEWLDEDVQGRVLRHHFTQVARQWQEGGREPSELYRGARLSTALDWSAGHATELNELEKEFLAASRQASEREADRQRRVNRRLRGLLVGVAAFLVLALLAGVLALVQRGSARRSAHRAERSATAAQAQRLGAQSLVAKSPDLSLLLARQAVALDNTEQTRGTLLAALLRWQGLTRVITPNGHRLLRVAVSPRGDWVAFSDNGDDLLVYDATTFRELRDIKREVVDMAASHDGGTLFVTSGREQITIEAFDVSTGDVKWTKHVPGVNRGEGGLALSPGGDLLAYLAAPESGPQTLILLRTTDGTEARRPISLGSFRGFTFTSDRRVATSDGKRTQILDLRSGRPVHTVPLGDEGFGFDASPAANLLAIGRDGGNIQLVDLSSGSKRLLSAPTTFVIDRLRFSPDGRTLGAAGGNGVVVAWDVATGTAQSFHGHTGNATDLGFSSDGQTMYTDALDATAIQWDLAGDRSLRRPFDAHDAPSDEPFFPYFAFTPDGATLAVIGSDHHLRFLDAATFKQVGALPSSSSQCCMPPAFNARGDRLATVSGSQVDLWDVSTRSLVRTVYTTQHDVGADGLPVDVVSLSADSRTIAANDNNEVLLLDADTGLVQRRLDAGSYVYTLLISPKGDLIAATDKDQRVTMWEAMTGRMLWQKKVGDDLFIPSFTRDERLYAVGTYNGLIHVYEARSGQPVGEPFIGDAGIAISVAFNPVTGVLASTGSDGLTTLNDPGAGHEIGSPLPGSPEAFSTVGWNPAGTQLVVVGSDGKGYLWDMTLEGWESRACSYAGRTLTRDEWREFLPDRSYRPACQPS